MERLIDINSTNRILLYTVKKKYIFLHFSRKKQKIILFIYKDNRQWTMDNGLQSYLKVSSLSNNNINKYIFKP